ncbi:MAG: tol-pal system YbgF family protein, partial [Kiritimatiellales bacterium]
TGEHYYNREDYARAQSIFTDIADRFPQNDLADDSLFWAGSSLLKQNLFLAAFTTCSRLAKDYPQSPLLMQARFIQGETLTELGEFSRAILAYDEIIKNIPDHPLADRARGRLADCLFTLGTNEPGRYQEAFDAYQALYKRPAVPFALKLQALYKAARCEDKTGLADRALARYMEVVSNVTGQTEPLPPEAALWFSRAAFDAASMQEREQKWNEAVAVYHQVIEAGVPVKDAAAERIEQIQSRHTLQ